MIYHMFSKIPGCRLPNNRRSLRDAIKRGWIIVIDRGDKENKPIERDFTQSEHGASWVPTITQGYTRKGSAMLTTESNP